MCNKCYHCNKIINNNYEEINIRQFKHRGYGSDFENDLVTLQLCNECIKLIKEEWFIENPIIEDEYIEWYEYEDDLMDFIDSCPTENRDLIIQEIKYDKPMSQETIESLERYFNELKLR